MRFQLISFLRQLAPNTNNGAGVRDYERMVRARFGATLSTWREVYDERNLYQKIYKRRMDAVLEIVDRLNLPWRPRILDIGCGPGVITVALARRGLHVTGIDCASEMTEAAQQLTIAE